MMEKSFEQQMERIFEIAKELDMGGISLQASLKLYEEAVNTLKLLKDEIETAEGKVFIMRKGLDGFFAQPDLSEQMDDDV